MIEFMDRVRLIVLPERTTLKGLASAGDCPRCSNKGQEEDQRRRGAGLHRLAVMSVHHQLPRGLRQSRHRDSLLQGALSASRTSLAALTLRRTQYGLIFDTRWPSKRFKNTRRFCYVQFTAAVRQDPARSLGAQRLIRLSYRLTLKPHSLFTILNSSRDSSLPSTSLILGAKREGPMLARTRGSSSSVGSPSLSPSLISRGFSSL